MRESIYKGVMRIKMENTKYVVKYILKTDGLNQRCKRAENKEELFRMCWTWAEENNDEFGNRFISELYDVFWNTTFYGIKDKK